MWKKVFLEISQNLHLCQSLFFNKVAETLAQAFSCEFCEISKNTFLTEHLWANVSITTIKKSLSFFSECFLIRFSNKTKIIYYSLPKQMSRKNRNVNSNNHLIEISVAGLSKQPPEVFYKKGVLRNFSKFTGKHLYQSLFFNKVAGSGTCVFLWILRNF